MIKYYGYVEKDILKLTMKQFNDRMTDIDTISKMEQGEGKGRVKRNKRIINERRMRKIK